MRARDSNYVTLAETRAMRAMAEALGLDPGAYTPDYQEGNFPHAYLALTDPVDVDRVFGIRRVVAVQGPDGWTTERVDTPVPYVPCGVGWPYCGRRDDDAMHALG